MESNMNVVVKPPPQLLQEVEIEQHIDTTSTCDECFNTTDASSLKRCSQCKEVKYCSKKCQARAWKQGHKVSCGKICVRPIPGKGLGVVAARDIKRGELLVSEMPLLNFTFGKGLSESLQKMNLCSRRKLMSLHDRQSEGGRRKTVLGVVVTNCLGGKDGKTTLVYCTISRFNHSCLPNVRIDQRFPTNVIAVRDIKCGDEVSWCYDIDSCMSQNRTSRQIELQQGWGIPQCRCQSCNMEGEELKRSDLNRQRVDQVEEQLHVAILNRSEAVVHLVKQKEELLRVEGLDTADTLARLRKDLMHGNISQVEREEFRKEGLDYAKLVKDDDLERYFSDIDVRIGCRGCYRCRIPN